MTLSALLQMKNEQSIPNLEDIKVVIRSIGERTGDACYRIVRAQVAADKQIVIIKDKPFAEAHYECIQTAIQSKSRWALFLDADILLRSDALQVMIDEAEKISIPFFMLNFPILDYGFNGYTYGVHFYCTKHLADAIQFRDIAMASQRPENQTCKEMAKIGIPSLASNTIIGLHGYEQFYSDLYRTTFVRAVKYSKHQDYMLRLYRGRYSSGNSVHGDFQFMFWGLIDGMLYSDEHKQVPLTKSFFDVMVNRIFELLGIQEKSSFILQQNFVDETLNHFAPDEEYQTIRQWIFAQDFIQVPVPERESILKNFFTWLGVMINRLKRSILVLLRG